MNKPLLLSAAALCLASATFAQYSEFRNSDAPSQFTLNSDNNTLSFAGRISAFYEWRDIKTGAGTTNDYRHNGFWPKDVDMDILGKTTSKWVYEVHISYLDLATAATTGNNVNDTTFRSNTATPDAPGIKAAYVEYDGFKIHIKLGYDKIPFSMWSMSDAYNTPFWEHPDLGKGDFFNRRDLGITLNTHLWNNRINLYAGAYSGVGEEVFEYGNDASGTLEYVGRAEFSYPSKSNYKIIDMDGEQTPTFRIGINGRYTDKAQPAGHSIYTDVPDALGANYLNFVDGYKTVYGGDFIAKYKGISVTFETEHVVAKPVSQLDPLYNGTPESKNKGVINAGGFTAGINYNWKPKKSVFSVNFEDLNVNDLVYGSEELLHVGYAYTVNRFNSVAKIEWIKPLQEDASAPLKYASELRIGYQIVF